MARQKFYLEVSTAIELEIDDAVINAVDDEWRQTFFSFTSPEAIAEHIAFNLVVNNAKLSQIEGWADQPDENAKIIDGVEWSVKAV